MRRILVTSALALVLAACQVQASVPAPPSAATMDASAVPWPSPSASGVSSLAPGPTPLPSPAPTSTELQSLPRSVTFSNRHVATRIVISRLGIDLPIMLQTANYGSYPLCDVAMYLPGLGQPGQGRATYIYAHAREGMFLPLLTSSQINDGQGMIGDIVEIYTNDSYRFKYRIAEVHRHTLDLDDAFAAKTEKVFLQTSEGPRGTIPKLQVVAKFISVADTDWKSAHPVAHPRRCS